MPPLTEIERVARKLERSINEFENTTPLEMLTAMADALELIQEIQGHIHADIDGVDLGDDD
jgi:hypothetical protein